MSNNSISLSGTVKRIHVETSDTSTSARFTLVGNNTVHYASTTDFEMRKNMELTTPGDIISFQYEEKGWLLKEKTFTMFKNITLESELKN